MLEEHLACPRCGYDLHGIPEVRCPECGFRYDAAALRSMAASAEWTRLAAARDVIMRATIAGALAVPAACDALGLAAWAQFLVILVAYVAAFLTWVVFTDAYRGLVSIPNLLTLFLALAVAIWLAVRFVLPLLGVITLAGSILLLGSAGLIRLRNWPTLSPPGNVRSRALRRSVIRHSVGGTLAVIAVSLLALFALVS
jgi:ribosomal protein L37E